MNPMNASEPREDAVAVLRECIEWMEVAQVRREDDAPPIARAKAAMASLAALLAQQGAEPVAWIHPQDLALLHKCRGDDHNGHVGVWMRSEPGFLPLCLANGAPR